VAVKVTDVPGITGLAEATMVTLTTEIGLTVTVMAFEVAGFPEVHVKFEVNMQVTKSDADGVYV
jgi:hypothetical protein